MTTPAEWKAIAAEQLRIVNAIFAPENFAKLGSFEERVAWNKAHIAPASPQVIGVVQGWNPTGGALW